MEEQGVAGTVGRCLRSPFVDVVLGCAKDGRGKDVLVEGDDDALLPPFLVLVDADVSGAVLVDDEVVEVQVADLARWSHAEVEA